MWGKFIRGNSEQTAEISKSEQTAEISKTGFVKIGHTTFSKPQWVGFSNKKLIVTNLKVGKFFPYPCLGFFHQNHHNTISQQYYITTKLSSCTYF